ncbi:hypothetical protein V1L52_07800 [Treponema sp. HNW]|uniref:hypothetical protein n=1 Tax=Treponema sp. HNW TaxID=3116654 RepID=UPI003D0C7EA7
MSIEHENLDITRHQDENGLEQYGVWVKRNPEEELAEEVREHQDDTNSSDIFLDDIDFENIPHADMSDSTIAESVIDTDLNDKIEEALDAEEQSAQADTAEDFMPDSAALEDFAADLEDFQLPEEEGDEPQHIPSVEDALEEKDIETFTDTSTVDIDLDEYMADSQNPEDSLLDEKPIDMDLSFEDNFETITPDFPKEEAPDEAGFEIEDVSDMFSGDSDGEIQTEEVALEDFEQSDTAVPENAFSEEKDEIPDIAEIPEMAELGEMEEFAQDSAYDFPVDFSSRPRPVEKQEPEVKDGSADSVIESIDISEFNTDIFPAVEASDQTEKSASETVYNIAVQADDDSDKAEEDGETEVPAANPAMQAMSTALFEKIIGELSLLRRDITDLKADLGALKNAEPECDRAEEKVSSKTGGGFFADDEEDETIALSGDELNNILTSADFTADGSGEEESEPEYLNEETAEEKPSMPVLNLEEKELTEPALDDIRFDLPESENEEHLPDEIALPVSEDLIVDSSNDDFFAEDDTPKDIDDTAMHFLSEEPAEAIAETEINETEKEETDEIESIDAVEEEGENVFEDTDIALDAEDIFGTADTQEAEEIIESDEVIESIESEEAIEEPALEAYEADNEILDAQETEVFAAEENQVEEAETETELPSAFDMDFEEEHEEPEDLTQFSPVGEVFNSKQWLSEEEAAAEAAEQSAEKADAKAYEKAQTSDTETLPSTPSPSPAGIPHNMREEIKSVLAYMDQLLENLPEEKIVEFARSEHFPVYKKLFTELGLS